MSATIKDKSQFYSLSTPVETPLAFAPNGFLRIAAKATCRKCERSFVQVCRTPLWREDLARVGIKIKKDKPSPELVVSGLMRSACQNGLGNPQMHKKGCPYSNPKLRGKWLLDGMSSAQMGHA